MKISLCGIEPCACATSNYIFATFDLLHYASFKAPQTTKICSQQPGTFSTHPFWTDLLMNVFLAFIYFSERVLHRTQLHRTIGLEQYNILNEILKISNKHQLTWGHFLYTLHVFLIRNIFIRKYASTRHPPHPPRHVKKISSLKRASCIF